MIEVYFRWYRSAHGGISPKFGGGRDGQAAKELYEHLKKQSRTKDDAGALAGLRWLLSGFDQQHYDKVQSKWTSLHQLNNNVNELVTARKRQLPANPAPTHAVSANAIGRPAPQPVTGPQSRYNAPGLGGNFGKL